MAARQHVVPVPACARTGSGGDPYAAAILRNCGVWIPGLARARPGRQRRTPTRRPRPRLREDRLQRGPIRLRNCGVWKRLELFVVYLPPGAAFLSLPPGSAFAFICASSLVIFAIADLSSAISARAAARSRPAAPILSCASRASLFSD